MQVKKVHGVEQTSPIETNDQSYIYLLAIDQLRELFSVSFYALFCLPPQFNEGNFISCLNGDLCP